MANTRKPAKGQAPKVEKTLEDAVVSDKKDTAPTGPGSEKGANTSAKSAKASAVKTPPPTAKPVEKSPKSGAKLATPQKAATAKVATQPSSVETDVSKGKTSVMDAKPADKSVPKDDAGIEREATSGAAQASKTPPTASPVAAAALAETPRRGGFVPMLLGGVLAATLGFGAARYPDQWPFVTGSVEDPIAAELAVLTDRLTSLESQGAGQDEALAALKNDDSLANARGEITGEFAQLRTQLETMNTAMTDLENRLHTVEKLPQGSGMEAAAAAATAYERELQQMREMLDQELAKISSAKEDAATLEVSAAEAAKAAGARAALARVLAAIDTGRPYGDALFDLTEQAGVEAPTALAAHADTGVMTLSALQSTFPEAARAALDASVRAAVAAGEMDRVSAFVRLQLGTRSLEPKDGTDADAILSRAEAALKTGQLHVALTELAVLPDAGKPALEGWVADAAARKDALAAGDALAQLVNKN